MSWYKQIKISATEQELRQIGVHVENGMAILYRGTNIPNLIQNDLRYGDYLSSVSSGVDITGNLGADSYGKYVQEYKIPVKDVGISNGELQYKGKAQSLKGGEKYPLAIYKAFNDYYGSNYTVEEIDKEDYNTVRSIASMAMSGGREEFDILMGKFKKQAQQKIQIPSVLYHATFNNNLESIKKHGLLPTPPQKCWRDCIPGVYLHVDPEAAYSYPETADDIDHNIPEEWYDNIIVLEINTELLDINLFDYDPNIAPPNHVDSFIYKGIIPFSAVKNIL